MTSKDKFQYALEHTKVLREPDHRIDTFGCTVFKYIVLSEDMDEVGTVRMRHGVVEAQKPAIIKPPSYNSLELDGFNEEAAELFDWLKKKGKEPMFLQYGFSFKLAQGQIERRQSDFLRIKEDVLEKIIMEDDPSMAVIETVDDSWQVGLLKFSMDMIQKSLKINAFDYHRKGLI